MERNVRVQNRVDAARPRRVLLRQCPHCGGDVRLARDIYGAYRQCIQCCREIDPEMLTISAPMPAETPHHHHVEERLAA